MADTTLKKNANGYNYKYTDLSQIHEYLESKGWSYTQEVEVIDGVDYIVTTPIKDGKECEPARGCRVVQATLKGTNNPAQEQGSALTYARRYSVLMAFGLCTSDDDAACMSAPKAKKKTPKQNPQDKVEKLQYITELATNTYGVEEFCKKFNLNKIGDLSEDRLDNCIKHLESL